MNRYIIITKKTLLIILAVTLTIVFTLAVFTYKNIIVATGAKERLLPIYGVERNDKKIALSFDAAWGADDTEILIEILGKHNIKTTFFVVGEWVDKFPDKVKALYHAGHEIQNHSNTHPHLSKLSKEKIAEEINQCNDKIQAICGARPTLMRPPYGDYDNKVIETTESLGMKTIQWSVDSLDWKDLSAEEINKRVLSSVKPGSIILFHNAAKHTPKALPTLIEQLLADGYEIVPISQLIYNDNYSIKPDGTQYMQKGGE